MTDPARYALYFTPQPGATLDAFGSAAIGYDAATGRDVGPPPLPGIDRLAQAALTAEPRRYGFHATLKAPFRLRDPGGLDALLRDLRDFAKTRPPLAVGPLKLTELGRFLALTPAGSAEAVNLFAAEVVAAFEPHRVPLSDDELTRRRASRLTPRQESLLVRWGYPYVFEEFRFHMTLTGPLPDDVRPAWREALAPLCADLPPVAIDAVSLLRQEGPAARFRLVERVVLEGGR